MTRSVDLWYFQTHKLFFSARMDGEYFRSFPKLTKLIKIDQNLHQIPNLRVQNDGLRDILVHVGKIIVWNDTKSVSNVYFKVLKDVCAACWVHITSDVC